MRSLLYSNIGKEIGIDYYIRDPTFIPTSLTSLLALLPTLFHDVPLSLIVKVVICLFRIAI